jgi:PBSX family phage terminase large subunit
MLDDNPYVPQNYKDDIKSSLSGVFYKRNYLGLWCLAEGAIFDFFDRSIHVLRRSPCAAEYYIAGIDYGASNPFCCLLVGVNTGIASQSGKRLWVEKEYYYDPQKTQRAKTNSEFAKDVVQFLEPYYVKQLYIDPSAASFKQELRKNGYNPIDANNEVLEGLQILINEMQVGNLYVMAECRNLIRELETYVWDKKASERGEDEPLKKDDHAVDCCRYIVATHKVTQYQPYKDAERSDEWRRNKYDHYRK